MTDTTNLGLITQTAERLFAAPPSPFDPARFDTDLWHAVETAGFPLALLSESQGGFGFSIAEAMAPLRVAATHAAPLPLAETMLANWVLSLAGSPPLTGCAALAFETDLQAVPFGRHLQTLVVVSQTGLSLHTPTSWREGVNAADEPRDATTPEHLGPARSQVPTPLPPEALRAAMACLKVVQIAGAVTAATEMSLGYVNDRKQFGRPLARFQAIQHQLAVMATHACAANMAADIATDALSRLVPAPDAAITLAAAAKVRAAEAATEASAIAHQVHGAIGFSHEYALHPLTRRLWAWRDEDGTETEWAQLLATRICALPPGDLWPSLTDLDPGGTP